MDSTKKKKVIAITIGILGAAVIVASIIALFVLNPSLANSEDNGNITSSVKTSQQNKNNGEGDNSSENKDGENSDGSAVGDGSSGDGGGSDASTQSSSSGDGSSSNSDSGSSSSDSGSSASADSGSSSGSSGSSFSSSGSSSGGSSSASSSSSSSSNSSSNSGSSSSVDDSKITVQVSINPNGHGGTSYSGSVTLDKGASVYDALRATGVSVNASDTQYGVYVRAIGGLAEKSAGGESGWKYAVNGAEPACSCSVYKLNSNATIKWKFVTSASESVN